LGLAQLLVPCRAPFWALDEEIFEKERALTAMQRTTAAKARYFTIRCRSWRGFNFNDFVLCIAVRTTKCYWHDRALQ
jgi:hypothetical protein